MRSPLVGLRAARALGWKKTWHYVQYQFALRSGAVRRRTPLGDWPQLRGSAAGQEPPARGRFFFDGAQPPEPSTKPWSDQARSQALAEAEAVLAGRFRLFGMHQLELGFPPAWNQYPPLPGAGGGGVVTPDQHWSHYRLESLPGDVKLLWELSRFGWAFTLARAYLWSQEDRFADGFWRLLHSWMADNPPNQGPQWASAQEAAFRLLALTFARYAFSPWLEADPGQDRVLCAVIAAHADRLPPTLAYSRAQGNNHLLAEGVGLLTAGLAQPAWPGAEAWRSQGRQVTEAALRTQIKADGGYVQHSFNYQRLALQLGLWAALLAQRNDAPLSEASLTALRRCAYLLGSVAQRENGAVPNFGPNDGTQLLPLSARPYQDFRPALQAAAAGLGQLPSFGVGPWDETACWLGLEPHPQPGAYEGETFPTAGLELLRKDEALGVLRAARFESRPGHVDQLHLDLWWRGRNLARDPGTYLYNGQPPWNNQLSGAAVHNAPVLDAQEPMRRAGRFLWLDWSQVRVASHRRGYHGEIEVVVAKHDGYEASGVEQRRTVVRAGERHWLVFDDLLGTGEHLVSQGWLLPQGQFEAAGDWLQLDWEGGELRLQVGPGTSALYRAGERIWGDEAPFERPQWGWYSPTYALRRPGLFWLTWWQGRLPLRLRSEWRLGSEPLPPLELQWGPTQAGSPPELEALAYDGRELELVG